MAVLLPRGLLLVVLALGFGPAASADVAGKASVIDGDTLEIRAERVRLWGVDAPESRQMCKDAAGRAYRCGQQAANALAAWIGQRAVDCRERDRDRYGRAVSSCSVAGQDMATWLATAGHAIDYTQYSRGAYAGAQASARAARRGVWQGSFQAPWKWRAAQAGSRASGRTASREVPIAAASAGCTIKGNVSSKGERIYHTPGQSSYADTRITESKGERWFCSPAQAQAAGWRAARGG